MHDQQEPHELKPLFAAEHDREPEGLEQDEIDAVSIVQLGQFRISARCIVLSPNMHGAGYRLASASADSWFRSRAQTATCRRIGSKDRDRMMAPNKNGK